MLVGYEDPHVVRPECFSVKHGGRLKQSRQYLRLL